MSAHDAPRPGRALVVGLFLTLAVPPAALPQSGGIPSPLRRGRGPAEIRDDHVLAQGRLTLPASTPATLGGGRWSVDVSVLWSNSFSWTQDVSGEDPEDRRFLIDGETVTWATEVRYGLGADIDLGARLPIHHRGGGILDGLIDVWHRWLRLPDGARPDFVRDAFRVEGLTTGSRPFEWTRMEGTGLGNLELHTRWRTLDGAGQGPSVALVGRLALPTATAPFADAGAGLGGQVVAALPLGGTVDVYGGAGFTVQDPGPVQGVEYARTRGQAFAAVEWRPWRSLSLVAETNAATRLVENIDSYPGLHWLLNVEGRLALGESTLLDVGVTENLMDQQGTTDLAFYFALGWRP